MYGPYTRPSRPTSHLVYLQAGRGGSSGAETGIIRAGLPLEGLGRGAPQLPAVAHDRQTGLPAWLPRNN